ncbi:ATP-binding protein [Filimonas effusa]|uniref:histidine kinase n=1 Tax=Filimonas effusa TaxID=2508721 RepID=A0A4Q1D357_9BACT|nr:ATP-binding protein [Filimonas effusa]RXK82809.1 PAS domain S-box protein [Filimonas effusa]
MKEIARVSLSNEMDLILAHRRSMKLAEIAGLSLSAQTTFATAVSEVARLILDRSREGVLKVGIYSLGREQAVVAYICDRRADISLKNPELQNARKLVNKFQITTTPEEVCIELYYNIPLLIRNIEQKIKDWQTMFSQDLPVSPYEEIKRKNEQLLLLAEKLKASENQYRTLTNALPLIIFTLNSKGQVVYTNNWMHTYTGYTADQLNEEKWQQVVHPEDHPSFLMMLQNVAAAEGAIIKTQCRIKDALTGRFNWHVISVSPLQEESNSDLFIGYIVDIHAQKEFEQAMRDNQHLKEIQHKLTRNEMELRHNINQLNRSNTELQQFAYVASHDLQEPVRKMIFYSDYFHKNYSQLIDEKGSLFLNNMLHASYRMRNLINDLLSFAKIRKEDTSFEPVELNEIASEALRDLEITINDKKASIHIAPLPAIEGNAIQLVQLFENIIANALKYGKTDVAPEIQIQARFTDDQQVRISFADNGIGFETKYLPKMFTLFQRLHGIGEYEGTGFGLAICKKIVDLHNGTIDASSTPGAGAVFTVTLPLLQSKKINGDVFEY